jgi:predicted nucleic acid-binding protein
MNIFLDTSALVKLFSDEAGSDSIKAFNDDPDNIIWISELASIELISAVFRKVRNNQLDENLLPELIGNIEKQIQMYRILLLDTLIVEKAKTLVTQYGSKIGLRTLDALHVATFLAEDMPELIFVSADKNQIDTVRELKKKNILI